ncbi:hypothetical protein SAMN05421736_101663 [Evansella caseinilytica]|uniref:Uncharacterized protein n=1 Tax=Evansella caseinilytica TaxID=1503961 RepID=A0A1H3I121_9BACI|nr:hypothetical protein [Evansella caseinilytica]SDY20809.1 hypothetical protein SAMN05421736_101663 [Evansella caseinilytica]
MIIWRGWGILNLIILILVAFLVHTVVPRGLVNDKVLNAFVFIISGIIIWYAGKALNAKANRVMVDQETGEQYRMGNQHSFFFIPMQYWGPIGLIGGIFLIVSTFFG